MHLMLLHLHLIIHTHIPRPAPISALHLSFVFGFCLEHHDTDTDAVSSTGSTSTFLLTNRTSGTSSLAPGTAISTSNSPSCFTLSVSSPMNRIDLDSSGMRIASGSLVKAVLTDTKTSAVETEPKMALRSTSGSFGFAAGSGSWWARSGDRRSWEERMVLGFRGRVCGSVCGGRSGPQEQESLGECECAREPN